MLENTSIMSRLIYLCAFLFVLSSCSDAVKSPEFKGVENLKIKKATINYAEVDGYAIYHNPNIVGGVLTKTDIDIFVNGKKITKINQKMDVKVPAEDDFKIPVTFNFNPRDLANKEDGILKSVLKNLKNKKVDVQYKGTVTIEILGQAIDVPVDFEDSISLGLNFN